MKAFLQESRLRIILLAVAVRRKQSGSTRLWQHLKWIDSHVSATPQLGSRSPPSGQLIKHGPRGLPRGAHPVGRAWGPLHSCSSSRPDRPARPDPPDPTRSHPDPTTTFSGWPGASGGTSSHLECSPAPPGYHVATVHVALH